MKNGEKVAGWHSIEHAFEKLEPIFERILSENDGKNSLSFCASHDTFLCTLIAKYTKMNERGEKFGMETWPCYLEGILLTKNFVVWRGEKFFK